MEMGERVMRRLHAEIDTERRAAAKQVRRLERAAERIAHLELATYVGRTTAIHALARLAHLVKAARAYAERLQRDARAFHEAATGHEEPVYQERS